MTATTQMIKAWPERTALLRALDASCAEVADTERRPTVRRALLRVVRVVERVREGPTAVRASG